MATRKQRSAVSRETTTAETANAPKPTVVTMATEREAREATEAIRTLADSVGLSYWKLGAAVREGIQRQYAKALGVNVKEWMLTCVNGKGNSIAKIYRAIKIVSALPNLAAEDLAKLSEGNAYALTQLPQSKRESAEWIEKAKTLETAQFKAEVDKALGRSTEKEEWYQPWARLPLTTQVIYDELIKKLGEEVFQVDLEREPQKLVMITEMVIVMLHQTPAEALREALVGEDENALPKEDGQGE